MHTVQNDQRVAITAKGLSAKTQSEGGSWMEAIHWVPEGASTLLDVGCNVGDFLQQCRRRFPSVRLAGIDINHAAIETAKSKLPDTELHQGYGFQLPFADGRFECVSCIEVIEHVPQEYRPALLAEIRRVMAAGGTLILRCPHAGLFRWPGRAELPVPLSPLVQSSGWSGQSRYSLRKSSGGAGLASSLY